MTNISPINWRAAIELQCDARDPDSDTYCWLHDGHTMFHENIQAERWCEEHASWHCRCLEYDLAGRGA